MEKLMVLLLTAIDSGKQADKRHFHKALYKQYFYLVYAVAKKWQPSLADDIVHEVFSCVLLRPLVELKPILVEGGFVPYLSQATFNRCRDIWMAKEREKKKKEDFSNFLFQSRTPNRGAIDFALWQHLLSEKEIEVLDLKFNEGLEYFEIRDKLGIEESTARQRLSRAIKKLRRCLTSPVKS